MLISPAYAQGLGGGDAFTSLLPLVLIFVVFYFLLIRPQQKKQKQHREMLDALRRGDRVVTAGGVIGSITKVNSESEVTIEIADGVRVKVVRTMISDILAKTEARDDDDDDSEDSDGEDEAPPSKKAKK